MAADILARKRTHFILWGLPTTASAPHLIIGKFQPGNPPTLAAEQQLALTPVEGFTNLWMLAAADCQLSNEETYHYWFEVEDTNPFFSSNAKIRCSDPMAWSVDWRLVASRASAPNSDEQPASVVKYRDGQLFACNPDRSEEDFSDDSSPVNLPSNNQMVIYELPTAWSRIVAGNNVERGVGTFRDVAALVHAGAEGANFSDLHILQPGRSYLSELGINALELLPAADSYFKREWGYDTAHFLAPDFELGFPDKNSSPTANTDLIALIKLCHRQGIRFFADMVMAFSRAESFQNINFDDFYIANPAASPDDPDAKTSIRGDGGQPFRDGFGSTLFRYAKFIQTYDPVSGVDAWIVPARQLMFTYLARWMNDFHIDGIRMDSLENIANWDFIRDFKNLARQLWRDRWAQQGLSAGADEKFLVVGEELTLPMDLLHQERVDGLWNDRFRDLVRSAITGQIAGSESSFEWTVRKAIDCSLLGFTDGTQAINYITSHDVEGPRRERLFNFLTNCQVPEIEKRIKLAFVCLLTAVGIPMIFAGEEFADHHDRFDEAGHVSQSGGKQVDPVNYSRLQDPMRKRIFNYVSRLVKLRTSAPALGVNDTKFIHLDFNEGKRVLVWQRGSDGQDPVIVLANFSDFGTANAFAPGAQYVVHNWPATPAGREWREVTQSRDVPLEQIGREPIFPWEAKVYTLK